MAENIDWTKTLPLLLVTATLTGLLARWLWSVWQNFLLPWSDNRLFKRAKEQPQEFDELMHARLGANHERIKAYIHRLFQEERLDYVQRGERITRALSAAEANTSRLAAVEDSISEQRHTIQDLGSIKPMLEQLNKTMATLDTTMRDVDKNLRSVSERLGRVEGFLDGMGDNWDGTDRRRHPRGA